MESFQSIWNIFLLLFLSHFFFLILFLFSWCACMCVCITHTASHSFSSPQHPWHTTVQSSSFLLPWHPASWTWEEDVQERLPELWGSLGTITRSPWKPRQGGQEHLSSQWLCTLSPENIWQTLINLNTIRVWEVYIIISLLMEGESASKKLSNLLSDSGRARYKGWVSWYLLSPLARDVFFLRWIFHYQG